MENSEYGRFVAALNNNEIIDLSEHDELFKAIRAVQDAGYLLHRVVERLDWNALIEAAEVLRGIEAELKPLLGRIQNVFTAEARYTMRFFGIQLEKSGGFQAMAFDDKATRDAWVGADSEWRKATTRDELLQRISGGDMAVMLGINVLFGGDYDSERRAVIDVCEENIKHWQRFGIFPAGASDEPVDIAGDWPRKSRLAA